MNRNTKRIGALGTATVAVMGVGVAYAAWTATATGDSYGKAKSITLTLTTVAGDAPTADLEPGGNAGALVFKLGPTGLSGNVHITDVTSTVAAGTCAVSFDHSAVTTWLGTTQNVPSAGGSFTIPSAVSLGSTSASTCQGQAIQVPVTVNVST
jgi:hypothetical protein